MEWINIKDKLPPLSYIKSDNEEDSYEGIHILVYYHDIYRNIDHGICVAYLESASEEDWDQNPKWSIFIPGDNPGSRELGKINITHWAELPKFPEIKG